MPKKRKKHSRRSDPGRARDGTNGEAPGRFVLRIDDLRAGNPRFGVDGNHAADGVVGTGEEGAGIDTFIERAKLCFRAPPDEVEEPMLIAVTQSRGQPRQGDRRCH